MKLVEVESNHSILWRFSASSAQQKTTMSYGGSCFRSSLNRFMSPDTIVPNPANPQSFNRYSYARNNPVNFTDPTGHRECGLEGIDCENPEPHERPPVRAPIEVNEWERQLLAITAFVEMHGHGDDQAVAITWVALNRMALQQTIAGVGLYANPNFSETSQVAGYVLRNGQFAISAILGEEKYGYELLQMGENGHWEPREGMSIQEVVAQAYERLNAAYDGGVDHILEQVVNEVIAGYNSGTPDPTFGSVFYGHISPDEEALVVDGLKAYAEYLGLAHEFRHQVFDSTRPNNPISLIVNNLTFAP